MIKRLYYIIAQSTDPYANLALEELLFHQVEDDMCILYLWQNKKTVVIGRNQNVYKECQYNMLLHDQGQLARRLSGGGAVFHDVGNLNFTFLLKKKNYKLDKQFKVILRALEKLGIKAEQTGRNDLTINNKKISGSAFYVSGERCLHHGTLMLLVNLEDLTKYLNVSKDKLKSNGVNSVKSRVTNIGNYTPGLTINQMMSILLETFEEEYELESSGYADEMLDLNVIRKLKEKYKSKEWIWGENIMFTHQIEQKFLWGEVRMEFFVEHGIIKDAIVFTDSLQTEWPGIIKSELQGCYFEEASICNKIDMMFGEGLVSSWLCSDLKDFIRQNI